MIEQIVRAVAERARNHEEPLDAIGRPQAFRQRKQDLALDEIDLVERDEKGSTRLGQAVEDGARVIKPARGIDEDDDEIGILDAGPGRRDHGAVETAARRENARRVDEDELGGAAQRDPQHAAARRLNLGRDDRQFRADKPVEQGRLAGIGRADQRDIAAAARIAHGATASAARAAAAAAVSAARFEEPEAVAGSCPSTLTLTVKRRRWEGPSVATVRYAGSGKPRAWAHS